MKVLPTLFALTLAAAAHADDAPLEALCAAGGGQLKRVAVSSVQRMDCSGAKVSWFRVLTGGNKVVGHYEATREAPWRPAIESALADLAVLCGELPPQLQFARHKLIADCGSDLK